MAEKTVQKCTAKVYDPTGWGNRWPCSRNGKIREDSQWWCKQHAPSSVKAHEEASAARFQAGVDRYMASYKEIKRLGALNAQLLEALEETAQYLKRLSQSQMGVDKPFAAHLADRAAKLFALAKEEK